MMARILSLTSLEKDLFKNYCLIAGDGGKSFFSSLQVAQLEVYFSKLGQKWTVLHLEEISYSQKKLLNRNSFWENINNLVICSVCILTVFVNSLQLAQDLQLQ